MLYPEHRELYQYIRGEKGNHIYLEDDTLDGGSLLAGLTLKISDLFVQPED